MPLCVTTTLTFRTLEQYLRIFVMDESSKWVQLSPWVEYSYNTTIHTFLGLSSSQVVYDKPPLSIISYDTQTDDIEAVDKILREREGPPTL